MALPKIAAARALSDEELEASIDGVKRKLFELRLNLATGREQKTHEFKHNRHRLAQLMTVESERKIAAAKEKNTPEEAPALSPEEEEE